MLIKKTDTSGLVTTTVLNTKISKVKKYISDNSKCITTPELREKKFAVRWKQADLLNKTDFDNKLTSFNRQNGFPVSHSHLVIY